MTRLSNDVKHGNQGTKDFKPCVLCVLMDQENTLDIGFEVISAVVAVQRVRQPSPSRLLDGPAVASNNDHGATRVQAL